ncbi:MULTISPECIES: alpha/beta fold hydrolase [Actinotignum]|uniref:alpha/beta fold hydrolase n=1 Tax=Actinotignum TaxID=1653174 RepID=UPI00254A38C2|nr:MULTISPECIES: alpha/beta hydrolase [Actinotignum]MDE1536287.1 alpha/beta hydrolase [Actinotignum schaalii]MDK7272111.1 alpha/beta hydrolase [Actinotignum schaalii]MDY5144379.1 alpha/beta hydrolase [Actinotignum timonense]
MKLATHIHEGAGIPLVLLHAMPMTSRMWEGVRAELSDLHTIAIDAPGFGDSPSGIEVDDAAGATTPHINSYLTALEETLAEYDSIVLAGISMGATVTAAYALRNPQQIAGLALLDGSILGPEPSPSPREKAIEKLASGQSWDVLAGWVDTMLSSAASPELKEKVAAYFKTVDAGAFSWLQQMMLTRPDTRGVMELDVPILLLRGVDDPNAKHEEFAQLHEVRPDQPFVELEGASHFSAVEKPHEVATALRKLYEAATR